MWGDSERLDNRIEYLEKKIIDLESQYFSLSYFITDIAKKSGFVWINTVPAHWEKAEKEK